MIRTHPAEAWQEVSIDTLEDIAENLWVLEFLTQCIKCYIPNQSLTEYSRKRYT